MKIPNLFRSMSSLEILLLTLFIVYLILPLEMPDMIAMAINSPLGMLALFILAVYMFLNVNPILAVVYILVAYELLRRSNKNGGQQVIVQYTPSQPKKDAQMKAMNPVQKATLEEEVVDKMAPIGHSEMIVYTASSFKPVSENIKGASAV